MDTFNVEIFLIRMVLIDFLKLIFSNYSNSNNKIIGICNKHFWLIMLLINEIVYVASQEDLKGINVSKISSILGVKVAEDNGLIDN